MSVTMRPPRVLVIEDRASIRALLGGLFTMLGYDAQPACDGVDALGWLKRAPYDLVVTDLTMPGASGWDVIAAIRRHAPGTPVIIVTGTATDADRRRAREQAVTLVDKPFRIEPFRAAVHRALSRSAA
jgi:CheY-like chemotaxis protein